MPVSVSTAGISLTLSTCGHSPYLICDEQRERRPDFCHLHCRYFLTPPSLRDTSPIFYMAKHRGGGFKYHTNDVIPIPHFSKEGV